MWGRKNILLINIGITKTIMQQQTALLFFITILFFSFKSIAQRGFEIGPTAGGSYYMGDVNMYKHFYSTHLNLGLLMKYHINPRVGIRLSGIATKLSAADEDFKNPFQQERNHSFETNLIEISSMVEITFLPYEIGDIKRKSFTPYIHTGLAAYLASSEQGLNMAVPIGMGIKKNIRPRLVIGISGHSNELFRWFRQFNRRRFKIYDPAYGTDITESNMNKQTGFLYNKDWYSFANLTISYTFKLGGLGCPAYYE